MNAGERHGQQRVAEGADADGAGMELALAARNQEAPRRRPERDDPLVSLALLAAPEEDARRAHVDAAEAPVLDLHRPLDAAPASGLRAPAVACHARIVGG